MRWCCSRTCSSLNLYFGLRSMFVVVCTTASGVRRSCAIFDSTSRRSFEFSSMPAPRTEDARKVYAEATVMLVTALFQHYRQYFLTWPPPWVEGTARYTTWGA